jgi:pentatricopeptide repeat protein
MEPTLNLFEHLLSRGRRFQQMGRPAEAREALSRLASFRDLPSEVSEETQVRLALLALKRRRFRQARRHLTAALRRQPDNARYHYLMAAACRADNTGDLERACRHYERSLELNPNQPRCRADCGLVYQLLGRGEDGLVLLRSAAEQAPDQAEVIEKVIRGLCQAGRADEARSLLRTALFRNPRSPRFRRLWIDFQFRQARRNQEVKTVGRHESEEPVLLPFPSSPTPPSNPDKPRRHDEAAALPGPHRLRLPVVSVRSVAGRWAWSVVREAGD